MDRRLIEKLRARETAGTLRSLQPIPADAADFCSNDYLGLAKKSIVLTQSGGTGSRLISGTSTSILEAEQRIAEYFRAESALMFNSGYDANLGFFSALPQRGDTILYDALIHASIRDGVRLSFAQAHAFRHNDVSDLEDQLKRAKGQAYVAVESVYSMDGDFAPLHQIAALCLRYKAFLVVDEAHAAGVLGPEGKGLCMELNSPSLLARLVTFGKAYGSHGACWLGSQDLITYLYNFARSFVYTTALPEAVYIHNATTLALPELETLRNQLRENVAYFQALAEGLDLRSERQSPIQIVAAGNVEMAHRMASACLSASLGVKAIVPPTVPEGQECVRICLHAFNTREEIQALVTTLRAATHTK